MTISNLLKKLETIMRRDDAINPGLQSMTQLVWMFFLKLWDDREREREFEDSDYVSPIPEQLRWRNWAVGHDGKPITGKPLLEFIEGLLFPGLRDLAVDGKHREEAQVVRSVFEDTYNYMRDGTLIRQIIDTINEDVDFTKKSDTHLFGDLYENLLAGLQAGAKDGGEFYTPRAVTQFMVDIIDPGVNETVLDPACGTGGFLTASLEAKRNKAKTTNDARLAQSTIRGVEKKPIPHMLATTNMILHGVEVPSNIRRNNMLASPLTSWGDSDRVDIILANPPYGGTEKEIVASNFPKGYASGETFDLFMLLFMRLLKKGTGRAAIVLPDGFLSGGKNKDKIKRKLLSEFNLHTIVRLPKGVFAPYTTIPTNILFFDASKQTRQIWYYQVPMPEGIKMFGKTRPFRNSDLDRVRAWFEKKVENDHAWVMDIESLIEEDGKNIHFDLDQYHPNFESGVTKDSFQHQLAQVHGLATSIQDLCGRLQDSELLSTDFEVTWPRTKELLARIKRSEKVILEQEYQMLGVRLDGNGPYHRETKLGSELSTKTVFKVKAGDFVYSRLFAWRGAFGVIPAELDGFYVSNEFPTYESLPDATATPSYIARILQAPSLLRVVEKDCEGSTPTTRNRYKEPFFADLKIPVPGECENLSLLLDHAENLRQMAGAAGEMADKLGAILAEVIATG